MPEAGLPGGIFLNEVNAKLHKQVKKQPDYKVGDKIEIIEKSLIGQIVDVNWHIKDDAPFYFVEVDRKKCGKRYRDCELKEVE